MLEERNLTLRKKKTNNMNPPPSSSAASSSSSSELIILGSGCSSGVPNPRCILHPSSCTVCAKSLIPPLESNPNYRCNTSLLINFAGDDGQRKYIQIDVGKNFREQVLRWFIPYKIPHLDAIILTHEHADAILGLDDIRCVQPVHPCNLIDPTPVYLTNHSYKSIRMKFPYLVNKGLKDGQEIRRVAQLEWITIDESPFQAAGLTFTPLQVMHGEDYKSLGFLFGRKQKVAYISDVSRFPEKTENAISKNGAGQVDLLILDTLYKYGSHNTHFCLQQSLDAVRRLQPKRSLFVGMTHEFDHHHDNQLLKNLLETEGIDVQLAHDGLRIPIEL